jgi:hypothetical protein
VEQLITLTLSSMFFFHLEDKLEASQSVCPWQAFSANSNIYK